MRLRGNRRIEREAVNAARAFFESCNCVFQEVDLGNDYGKDAYVDLVHGENVTGLCVALQIKGGRSYRRTGGYVLPLDEAHTRIWRASSVPVAGIVFDPDDRCLRWCNITTFLAQYPSIRSGQIPVAAGQVLTPQSLESEFKPSFWEFHCQRAVGPALLQLTSDDASLQAAALLDCFAIGRSEPRVFVLLRHLLDFFEGRSHKLAIHILSHLTPHADIFWHSGNWIPHSVRALATSSFRWSELEIEQLLSWVSWEEWGRGGTGEDLYFVLREDPDIEKKMGEVAIAALAKGNDDVAFTAMYLTIYWAGHDGLKMFEGFLAVDSRFRRLPLSSELERALKEAGFVTLFE